MKMAELDITATLINLTVLAENWETLPCRNISETESATHVITFRQTENGRQPEKCNTNTRDLAVPWLRRSVAGLPPRRPGLDPGSVHVGFVVEKVALGQGFPRVFLFSPVNFIPPVLHYLEKWKKLIIFLFIFIIGLHNKPAGCGASVASAAGPF